MGKVQLSYLAHGMAMLCTFFSSALVHAMLKCRREDRLPPTLDDIQVSARVLVVCTLLAGLLTGASLALRITA